MKLQLFKRDDGTWSVIARKTRPWEYATQASYGVAPEDVEKTIAELVDLVVGEKPTGLP